MYFLKGMMKMQEYLNAISLLPERYKKLLLDIPHDFCEKIKEIRFRVGEAVTLNTAERIYYPTESGRLSTSYSDGVVRVGEKDMQEIVFMLARRSLHTYQDMIVRGYIPLYGGCKAGVGGRAVMRDGSIYSVSAFNCVNIRVAREYHGCSHEVLAAVGDCVSYMIIGQPMSGKTTLLRDLCRYYSDGNALSPYKVAVVDERDEIASRSFGCSIDVGANTDVLTLYPKPVGTQLAVRTLSPQIIVLDEIGTEQEARALLSAMNCGVDFIATAHGSSFEEVARRPNIKTLLSAGVFKKAVVLAGHESPCRVRECLDL